MTTRLIEKWLPIAALGEESVRERRSMTALPPVYYLHVWWARRPLVASRAAILASLLPADADRERFLHVIGIHGDPVAAKVAIEQARRTGVRVDDPYRYERAFSYSPSDAERSWIATETVKACGSSVPQVLDPTAGGGSIPFESVRLGFQTFANDLNPVAALILRAAVEWPVKFDRELLLTFERVAQEWRRRMQQKLAAYYPQRYGSEQVDIAYLYARSVLCPYCNGRIPLTPNWKLASDGTGVSVFANPKSRTCEFTIVGSAQEQSPGTVARGDARCPFPDCGRLIENATIKQLAQNREMGEQLFAVVCKQRKAPKKGRKQDSWERCFRAPTSADDLSSTIQRELASKIPEWEINSIVPTEALPMNTESWTHGNTSAQYDASSFTDLFSPRQLLSHCTAVEIFRDMLAEDSAIGELSDLMKAAYSYLALTIDRSIDYNARLSTWDWTTGRARHVFVSHDFAFIWQYCEMGPLVEDLGYDWTIWQTTKCIKELTKLSRPDASLRHKDEATGSLFADKQRAQPIVTITNESADSLGYIEDHSLDAVVMDPPYYDNVMYAELSDFFYVWLKRTAGHVYPDLFRRSLTDKDREAVANLAKFDRQKGAKKLAAQDYQQRMAAIFSECHRVLKADGILTLMFTHKATGAWDALASGLMIAGFTVTASWPINTEAEGSLHIREKAAANSTIFLICRPRTTRKRDEEVYWEDVEPLVGKAVRERISEFEQAGIKGVDLYLSCFGPALQEFAKHWPLKRGQPRAAELNVSRRKQADDVDVDPYAVTPEDALDAARREVKRWKLDRLLRTHRKFEMDPLTEWFVLAWDAFKAPEFPYDEGLRLARVVGIDIDREVVGKLAEKKGSGLVLWDSAKRAAKAALGPTDGSRALIDALHHAAHRCRTQGVEAARELLAKSGADHKPGFPAALAAVLEVLPISSTFTHIADETGPVAEAASDFDALEHLRRLAFSEKVARPQQLEMWSDTPQ